MLSQDHTPRIIPLTKDQVAFVCHHDWHELSKYHWTAVANHSGSYYANRHEGYMHRFVNKTPLEMHTDHINHDTLDNRCVNLRTTTRAQNQRNRRGPTIRNSSGVIGVTDMRKIGYRGKQHWKSTIGVNGGTIVLGHFKTREEAIAARKAAEVKYGYLS